MLEEPFLKTFERACKQSYSHGLEAIYTLENIDIKSVRLLKKVTPVHPQKKQILEVTSDLCQLELDLGKGFRHWVTPCVLDEPIQVLELPRYLEKILTENGKGCLKELLSLEPSKEIGQGQVDEIRKKIKCYLHGKEYLQSRRIEIGSLIRALIGNSVQKKAFFYLSEFGLESFAMLLPSENLELKRLTLAGKKEWSKQALEDLTKENKINLVRTKLKEIGEGLLKPWLRSRFGLATDAEILEKADFLCGSSEMLDAFLLFLKKTYNLGVFPLGLGLIEISSGIYAADLWHASAYQTILNKAETYFYNRHVSYELSALILWIQREFAMQWIEFPSGMIEKVLRFCDTFYFQKESCGMIRIQNRPIL